MSPTKTASPIFTGTALDAGDLKTSTLPCTNVNLPTEAWAMARAGRKIKNSKIKILMILRCLRILSSS
jgi:hypothetical protein